ncbi:MULTISPECIES: ABC transporter ATP-binding protein [Haloarcula]|uniref:ABC-type D-xylose/L-arabinose transporter n=1 Tax=Haloarcula pellucida TaxID=1427151 RepID=A0A830GM06_9EURY|nr:MULTISPECIES: ABC transporter ATP-binding protein [Halomicroarcula]MBX0350464.1 ABC transporter ATP-binding protein [Halomicroarcula pellucida]MDS0278696.1 ABC transporter ATP-binding protein [Halomicroarcula sp. S1AR25-4]GGN91167.1 ABC transporter ATP-binding protein [Halomicroarcula pellucida]
MGELAIQNLTKIFHDDGGDIVAVDSFDAEIDDGEFIVLVGPSGCGKSTTLRMIAGLETPTEGDIVLDGETVTEKKPKSRNMAMVFQSYALYPHMTARENMAFGLKMTTDLSEDEIDDRVQNAADMMGIGGLLNKKPDELSGGQQQRVALGRAIVREPEVFLMDEPLSNLDAKLRTQMRTELQELQQEFGVTTIYVTHDQTEAMTMSDRIAVLDDGQLQQLGTPLECYHEPANQFVAGFIGSPSMNFFDVELDTSGPTPTLVHDAFEYELDDDVYADIEGHGSRFTLGIRPEDVKAVSEGTHNALSPTVQVTEPLGDVSYVYLDIAGEQYTATLEGDIVIESGRTLTVQFPQDRIHVFDGKTGEALRNRDPPDSDDVEALVGLDDVSGVEIGVE